MSYKHKILVEESLREIIRNKTSLIFSSLVLTVLATIYFLSLSYSFGIFNSQKSFFSNNPLYAILSNDVAESDMSFILNLLSENFKGSKIQVIDESSFDKNFWKELGTSKEEIRNLGFSLPKVLKIIYHKETSVLEINNSISRIKKNSEIVKSFVYNDEGFSTSINLWNKTKSYALFYIFSSLFSLIFFIFILLCFLALEKKENLKILDYLGASDQFSLIPLFIYSFSAFLISGVIGLFISSQLRSVLEIEVPQSLSLILLCSYLLIFIVCYLFFPYFVNKVIRAENA